MDRRPERTGYSGSPTKPPQPIVQLREYLRGGLPPAERDAAERAFLLLETRAPESKQRALQVAGKLIELGAAPSVVNAALLTPVVRCSRQSPKDLAASFGGDSARLLAAIHQAHPMIEQATRGARRGTQALLERFAGDIRVLFIVLADRLVDLEEAVSRLEQDAEPAEGSVLARATETLDFYVPLADRLGLVVLRQQLEDAAFHLLAPETYDALLLAQGPIREADAGCLGLLRTDVQQILEHHEIQGTVEARIKSLYGLHQKMRRSGRTIEDVMDKLGMRIVVSSVPDCYAVLGLLHTHYRPIPGTFDDYIGRPKANGYQSLHTCVHPVREISSKPVEFQIRTWQMHQNAQLGAASHWRYKSDQRRHAASVDHRAWLATLPVQHRETATEEAFIARLWQQVFEDRLVVFVPDGRQVRVPEGATVRDVLLQCGVHATDAAVPVTVNSRPASLGTPLADGDSVAWASS